MWLFPETRSARSRALLSIMALVVMTLSATQNRGGLLGATAGAVVGLAFLPSRDRLRLIVRAIAVIVIGLGLAVQLSLQIPNAQPEAGRSRRRSSSKTLLSLQSAGSGNATGTVAARDLLWSLVFNQQVADGKLIDGYGFGVNLPYLVNDTQVTNGPTHCGARTTRTTTSWPAWD